METQQKIPDKYSPYVLLDPKVVHTEENENKKGVMGSRKVITSSAKKASESANKKSKTFFENCLERQPVLERKQILEMIRNEPTAQLPRDIIKIKTKTTFLTQENDLLLKKKYTSHKPPTSYEEAKTLRKLKGHSNIVCIREDLPPHKKYEFVLQNPGACLHSIRQKMQFDYSLVFSLFYQTLEGLSFLQEKGYIHQNLTPKNLCLANDGTLKISNFTYCQKKEDLLFMAGTPYFWPPLHLMENTALIDTWSASVAFVQLCQKDYHFVNKDYHFVKSIGEQKEKKEKKITLIDYQKAVQKHLEKSIEAIRAAPGTTITKQERIHATLCFVINKPQATLNPTTVQSNLLENLTIPARIKGNYNTTILRRSFEENSGCFFNDKKLEQTPLCDLYRREGLIKKINFELTLHNDTNAAGNFSFASQHINKNYEQYYYPYGERNTIGKCKIKTSLASLCKQEISILKELAQCPYLVKLSEKSFTDKSTYLLTEYCGENLSQKRQKATKFPEKTLVSYMHQAATAVHYLHSNKFVHRNINPTVFCVDQDDHLKLVDLTYSQVSGFASGLVDNINYWPLSLFFTKPYISLEQADTWALSVTFAEIAQPSYACSSTIDCATELRSLADISANNKERITHMLANLKPDDFSEKPTKHAHNTTLYRCLSAVLTENPEQGKSITWVKNTLANNL